MTLPDKLLRHTATLACGAALAGCVALPVEELLASTTIVAELKLESGALVEAARFSAGHAGDAPPGDWGRFVVSPFATQSEYAPVGTITSNDQTDKIQTIDVGGGIGEWREFRRNVLEDYRRAFGEEPWDIVAVGVMTDTSNTRGKASAQYGDISFRPAE